jgi:signal peptidase
MIQRIWKFVGSIVTAILLVLLVLLFGFTIKGKIDGGAPAIANYRLYIVLSGSMQPVFDAGSLVVVRDIDPDRVRVGDIIAFKNPDPGNPNMIITHRVVAVLKNQGSVRYVTKGDANNTDDPASVPTSNLVGKVDTWVPYAGYFFDFAKSKDGLLCLIILPGMLLVGEEIWNLFKYAKEWEEDEDEENRSGMQSARKRKTIISLAVIGLLSALVAGSTFAYFTSTASNNNNNFRAGTLVLDRGALNASGGWTIVNAYPGYSQSHTLTIKNGGALSLDWTASIAGSGNLFRPVYDPNGAYDNNPSTVSLTPASGELDPGMSTTVTATFNMPMNAGNGYQATTGTVTVSVNGTQITAAQ